jgi:hypothetical protein
MPAPTVTNPTVPNITPTSAILGGEVAGDAISARGVVYAKTSTNSDPVHGGAGVIDLTATPGTGVFTVNAIGLQAGVPYSFKAYATNNVGTSYSPVSTFDTLPPGEGAVPAPSRAPLLNYLAALSGLSQIVSILIIAMILAVAYWLVTSKPSDSNDSARGLITIVFLMGTVGLAIILTLSALFSDRADFKERFDKGKEILSIMIGIFGTIMGFYFGSITSSGPGAKEAKALVKEAAADAKALIKEAAVDAKAVVPVKETAAKDEKDKK